MQTIVRKIALAGAIALTGAVARTSSAADTELLRKLVAIPSVSSDTQQICRVMRAMKAYLEPRGVCCVLERHPSGVEVLYASTTPGKGHDIVLSAHLDVVPAVSPDQYEMKLEGTERAVGRGTGDCKGCCVAIAEALVRLVGKASVGCIFGADEETGGYTTTWMVEERGYAPKKIAVVVDGSPNKIITAIKGQTMFKVTAKGKGGHSSQPWLFDDSILRLSEAYVRLRKAWDAKFPLPEDKWTDVLSATVVRSEGEAMNRIPDTVSLVLNLRSVRPESKDEALEMIRSVTGMDVEVVRHSDPCSCDPDHPLIGLLRESLHEVNGVEIGFKRANYATDARCFAHCTTPTVTIGVSQDGCHGEYEWVSLPSVDRMTKALILFCSRVK